MKREVLRVCHSFAAVVLFAGCGGNKETTQTITSAAPSASPAPSASSSAHVRPALQRKANPIDKRKADEAACGSGKMEACRALADRYRGYGHMSGCGVEREKYLKNVSFADGSNSKVRIKRRSEDWEADENGFTKWIRKACDLGDAEACGLDRKPTVNFRAVREKAAADIALRSSVESSALFAWKKVQSPKVYAKVLEKRNKCTEDSYLCAQETFQFYRRDVTKAPTELEKATRELAESIITNTLDARTIFLLLDKNGYTPEMISPVREHAGKVLVEACLEGSCTCGEAAYFVAKDDPRRLDLARLGCENGEAEGCYELGRIYEDGSGVPKDEKAARVLYELACPSYRPMDYADEPKTAEYSPAACDRLAEFYEAGVMPPKDLLRARYYAEFACRYPGMQLDHAPCIRLARYWASRAIRSNCEEFWCAGDLAQTREKFNGPSNAPFEGKECERPSVKALCDKHRAEIESMGKKTK